MKDQGARIEFANTLRGWAAILVVISHYVGSFWSSPKAVGVFANTLQGEFNVPMPTIAKWVDGVSPFINFGAFGVAIFFLISGFVIPFSLQRKGAAKFLVGRVFRIYPTYLVGFSVTVLALLLSSWYFANPFPYTFKEVIIHYVLGLRDVLWSRHIDGIVWTLEIEIKFYLICGLFACLFRKKSILVFLIPIVLFLLSLWLLIGTNYLEHIGSGAYKAAYILSSSSRFLCFMFIGVGFNYLYHRRITLFQMCIITVSLALTVMFLWSCEPFVGSISVVKSYGFALIVFSGSYLYRSKFSSNRLTSFLANVSYPLYVVHAMLGYVLMSILISIGVGPYITLTAAIGISLVIAQLVHKYVESPMMSLNR